MLQENLSQRRKRKARLWALAAACVVFAALIAVAYLRVRAGGAGQVFTLDDAYISAAVGRHILLDHTWGVSPHSFSSASSSILWPLLLAGGFAVCGVHMAVPFALNVLFALGVLGVAWRVLAREAADAPGWFVLAVLLVVTVATPLPMMVFVGMEHNGFALASLLFMAVASGALAKTHREARASGSELLMLGVAAAFACSLRYEGMFQAAIVCGLFLLRRRWLAVLAVALGAALPIVSFGAFAVRRGGALLSEFVAAEVGGRRGEAVAVGCGVYPEQGVAESLFAGDGVVCVVGCGSGIGCHDQHSNCKRRVR